MSQTLGWLFSPRRFSPQRVVAAAQTFIRIEASSGIVLLVAAVVALVWANSPLEGYYFDLIHTRASLNAGPLTLDGDLQHWVNDGLMTVFFFLVGLEIKRELVHGELSELRRAFLPAAAALGGMVAPALIYTAFNYGGPGASGWGIPMATDIAFALGVLSLLSRRVPFSVKVFLLAIAIADDIGAILVIAVFYTAGLSPAALAAAAAILAGIVVLGRSGVRSTDLYVLAGVGFWLAVFESGIHATIAGVVLGLMTPASPFYTRSSFLASAEQLLRQFRAAADSGNSNDQQGTLSQLEDLAHGNEAPLDRLERQLHPWVSYLVVPAFAFANAGVAVSGDVAASAIESPVTIGVALGLLIGKPAGIFLFTWLAVRLRLSVLPAGATWAHIAGIGILGGIGFTVSLLINGLAFSDPALVDEAKIGVLAASAVAGVAGFIFLRLADDRQAGETSGS